MSTKIYTAWRCRPRLFYLALDEIRKTAFEYAAKTVRDEIKRYDPKIFSRQYAAFLKEKKQDDKPWLKKLFEVRLAFSLAQDASRSTSRLNQCDIDASLNVWLEGDHVYMIGYGEVWNQVDHTRATNAAEDYSYWNNTDRPKNVTHQQWRQREKNWDRVTADWDAARLVHKIIEAKDDTGLHELALVLLPKADPYMVVP